MRLLRGLLLVAFVILLWQVTIIIFQPAAFLFPSPNAVYHALVNNSVLIGQQSAPTLFEILAGLSLGTLFGMITAITLVLIKPARLLFLPIVLASQAIPTFAIAPLLVVWFGYGETAKIITTIIMIFFPITSNFYDGLNRTPTQWLQMAWLMQASKWRKLWYLQIPAALPSLGSGLRVAVTLAPIGAIVSEWVGSSRGLGFLMLNANARVQTDLLFAIIFLIMIFTLLLYFVVDFAFKRLVPWVN